MEKVLNQKTGLKFYLYEEQFTCFDDSNEKVDELFPTVKFAFEEGLSLTAYPHDYMFLLDKKRWCFGWQKSMTQTKDGRELILLGDMLLSNKLFVYDLENTIGWTDYNCSSSITVKDDKTGSVYTVGAHNLSSTSTVLLIGRILTFFLLLVAMLST
ncbi:Aspartic proteinase protein 2 [Spatholobus suberectus]|nr:Aspartic proteinase protein 2 [Spatholobus suberectus]